MSGSSPVSRRTLFSLAGGSLLVGQMPGGLQAPLPAPHNSTTMVFGQVRQAGPVLHVAGPRDGILADWARRLFVPMAAGLSDSGRLALLYGGGSDGVTMANQFDARVAPDGQNALLFPGSVAMDWLAGQGLVRLDPARMLPLMAALGPGVLMLRGGPGKPSLADFKVHGQPLRLAAGTNRDAALTALLGLDLLGIPARLVAVGLDAEQAARADDAEQAARADAAGQAAHADAAEQAARAADAVFLHGPSAAAQATRLAAAGWAPVLSTGTGRAAEPAHPALHAPHFLSGVAPERLAGDPLVEAWRAAAAASALCAVMVLPRLSPAASIGRWRHAARLGMSNGTVAEHAKRQAMILVADNQASAALSPMRADGPTQRALHGWMAGRAISQRG